VPVTESNGKVVCRQLQAAAAKTGVPRAIVSDGGSDLHAGIERFCQAHPRTAWLYDIKHKTACLLKHALERDASWQTFVEKVRRWREMLSAIGAAEHYVRHEGIHAQAAEELAVVPPKSAIPAVQRLRKQLLEFIAVEGRQAGEGERLLGSSEVLESIIGKFKHVAGERGQHGLTGMVLSIGALVGNPAVATVQAAMTETTTTEVWQWCRTHLGATVQSVRQRIRQALHPEHNQKTLRLENG